MSKRIKITVANRGKIADIVWFNHQVVPKNKSVWKWMCRILFECVKVYEKEKVVFS